MGTTFYRDMVNNKRSVGAYEARVFIYFALLFLTLITTCILYISYGAS